MSSLLLIHKPIDITNIEKTNIIDGKDNVISGDAVIGIQSSGAHTNGFSLIRKIFNTLGNVENNLEQYGNIIKKLCYPHRSYLNDIQLLLSNDVDIHALCHITGGGLVENPKRVLPDNLTISFDSCIYEYPEEFQFLKEKGNVSDDEMIKVFNCGIGMLVIVDFKISDYVLKLLNKNSCNNDNYIKIVGRIIEKNILIL